MQVMIIEMLEGFTRLGPLAIRRCRKHYGETAPRKSVVSPGGRRLKNANRFINGYAGKAHPRDDEGKEMIQKFLPPSQNCREPSRLPILKITI